MRAKWIGMALAALLAGMGLTVQAGDRSTYYCAAFYPMKSCQVCTLDGCSYLRV